MPSTDHWRRFALMDVMVIVLCCALGLGVARAIMRIPEWSGYSYCFVLALGLTVPAVLATQRWFRGRRVPLGPGERIGLYTAAGIIGVLPLCVMLMTTPFAPIAWLILCYWLWLQAIHFTVALYTLRKARKERRTTPKSPWTEWLGLLVCISTGMWILFMVADQLRMLIGISRL
jgi:hypothetical protein